MIPTLHSPENFKVGIQHMSFISNVAAVIKCDEAYTRLIVAADVFLVFSLSFLCRDSRNHFKLEEY